MTVSVGARTVRVASVGPAYREHMSGQDPTVRPATQQLSEVTGHPDIEHIVVLIKENATFDHYFGRYGNGSNGVSNLRTGRPWYHYVFPFMPTHGSLSTRVADHHIPFLRRLVGVKCQYGPETIGYMWDLAKAGTLLDNHFSAYGPSDANHMQLMIGTTKVIETNKGNHVADLHDNVHTGVLNWFLRRPAPPFGNPSLVSQLIAAGKSCANYGNHEANYIADIVATDATQTAAGNAPVLRTSEQFASDVLAHKLPAVSWVTAPAHYKIPDYWNSESYTEELPYHMDKDMGWNKAQIDALKTAGYWDKTLVVVVYDDWGGYYDHVQRPVGRGPRVPVIVTGGPARSGHISHEFSGQEAVPALIDDVCGLSRLDVLRDATNLQDAVTVALKPTLRGLRGPGADLG